MTTTCAAVTSRPLPLTVYGLQRAIAAIRSDCTAQITAATAGRTVLAAVAGAHPTAGASTVALAVAECAGAANGAVLLVEEAPAGSLSATTDADLGEDGAGWRLGRRGPVTIASRTAGVGGAAGPDVEATRVVVDVGTKFAAVPPGCPVIVVCRPTVPSVREAEQALASLPGATVIACIGPIRWPRLVRASAGPRVSELLRTGRVVRLPTDRRLAVAGLTPAPPPRPVLAAARSLIQLLGTVSGGES